MMTAQHFFCASVGAVLVCTGVANAGLIFVDFTSAGQGVSGNVGMTYRPIDINGDLAPFLLIGQSGVDPSLPWDPFANGDVPGMVNIGNTGAGVTGPDGGGSGDISGLGGFQNEQLVIEFDIAVPRDNLVLRLTMYDPGNGFLDKDDPAIFVFFVDGTIVLFDETHIVTGGGQSGTLFLNELLPENAVVAKIIVRETFAHYRIGSLQLVPAPGALALLGLGALAQRRRRRSA